MDTGIGDRENTGRHLHLATKYVLGIICSRGGKSGQQCETLAGSLIVCRLLSNQLPIHSAVVCTGRKKVATLQSLVLDSLLTYVVTRRKGNRARHSQRTTRLPSNSLQP